MPIDIVPKSLYPFVPQFAGVPALLRSGAQIFDSITLGVFGLGDVLSSIIGPDVSKWAVLDPSGTPIADYDSVFAVGYQNTSKTSEYPLEKGAFASYNKVESSFSVHVTLNKGGTEAERAQFMAAVETARRSMLMFTVVTPEFTYENVNFNSLSVSRTTENGAGMVSAELVGLEIRQRANAAYSQPKDPSAYDPSNLGQVQTYDDATLDTSGVV
jgi:hypothetical protein